MADFLPQIKAQLGVYQRVHVVGGVYHQARGNVNEVDRNGRNHVVGTQMRCGVREMFPDPWSWPTLAVPVDDAHASADPCPHCFDLRYAVDGDQVVMAL